MLSVNQIERRVAWVGIAFLFSLFALAALAIQLFNVGLPTCITDIKPFQTGEVIVHSPTHYEVHYVARMWNFEPEDVTVPAGSTVDIYISTADVTHGAFLLGTNVNLMVLPGVVNYARVKFDQPRDYQLLCHEFCGTGHQTMSTMLHVVDPTLLRGVMPGANPASASQDPGYALLRTKTCLACHSVDGRPGIGPTFKGLFGQAQKMTDGTDATADEAYLRESVHEPNARVVAGFQPVMPKLPVSDEELEQIISYLKTLE
jgi:cytochrome c oxidase subunit 2